MAMGTNSDQLMSEINVTPFVDVMLVLLIIFMVSAPMMVQGVDVSLPKATGSPLQTETDHLVVTVDKDGKVFILETAIPLEGLKEKLSAILQSRTDKTVYFRADMNVSYGIAMQVLSEIRAAGVDKLGMITEPANEPGKEKGKPQKAHS